MGWLVDLEPSLLEPEAERPSSEPDSSSRVSRRRRREKAAADLDRLGVLRGERSSGQYIWMQFWDELVLPVNEVCTKGGE